MDCVFTMLKQSSALGRNFNHPCKVLNEKSNGKWMRTINFEIWIWSNLEDFKETRSLLWQIFKKYFPKAKNTKTPSNGVWYLLLSALISVQLAPNDDTDNDHDCDNWCYDSADNGRVGSGRIHFICVCVWICVWAGIVGFCKRKKYTLSMLFLIIMTTLYATTLWSMRCPKDTVISL